MGSQVFTKSGVFSGLFGPTGGVNYHVRALLHSASWARFLKDLDLELQKFRPVARNLLLIGPSGGHCLSTDFLKKFDNIVCYDIDPSAKDVFQLRHPQIRARWRREDAFFNPPPAPFSTERIGSILSEHKNHAVLFCNVLGQLGVSQRGRFKTDLQGEEKKKFGEWKSDLVQLLENRGDWFSFHDLASTLIEPTHKIAYLFSEEKISAKKIAGMFFEEAEKPILRWHGWQNQFINHDRVILHWPLSGDRHHLIECIGV